MKDNKINFLFLGGAKRVSMCRLFKEAAMAMGFDAEFFSYELAPECPIATVATVIRGLRWSDPALMEDLDIVVNKYDIGIIIPFVDPAIEVAIRYREMFGNKVFVPCGSLESSANTFNKRTAARILEAASLPIPRTFKPGMQQSNLIAKPSNGSASKGILYINSPQELAIIFAQGDKYLIQEYIDNREEITVDCYVSLRTGEVSVSPRIRLEVSGGEAVRTRTIADEQCWDLARRTIETFGLKGAVTVQLIRDLDRDVLLVMEINARLGGGAVASVYAGLNIPALIISDFLGRDIKPTAAQPGVLTTRYPADVVFK